MQVRKSNTSTVSSNAISGNRQGVYVDPSSAGQDTTRGFRQGLGVVTRVVDREQDKALDQQNTTAIMEADTQLSDFDYQMSHDKENGYLNKKGRNALGGTDKLFEDYQSRISDISATLTPDQSNAFARLSKTRLERFRRKVSNHENNQYSAYQAIAQQAAIQSNLRDAIANPTDQDIANQAISRIRSYHGANIHGLPDEAVQLAIENDLSSLHRGRIERLIDNNPNAARALFKQSKDQMTPADFSRVEKMVKTGTQDQAALVKADTLILKHEDYASQITEARKIKDATQRDAVLSRLDRNKARNDRIERQTSDVHNEQALKFIDDGGSYEDMPMRLRLKLSGTTQTQLKDYDKRKSGNLPLNDAGQALFYDDVMSGYEQNKTSILDVSTIDMATKLEGAKLDKVLQLRRNVVNNKQEKPSVSQVGQFVNLALETKIIKKNQKALFRLQMEEQLDTFSQGKEPSFQDLQSIYDDLSTKLVFDPSGWFNTKSIYGYELTGEEDAADLVVPDKERSKIIDSWQSRFGNFDDLTEEKIKKLYTRKVGLSNE